MSGALGGMNLDFQMKQNLQREAAVLTPVFQHFKLMLEFSPLKLLREFTCDISRHQFVVICCDSPRKERVSGLREVFWAPI